MQVTTWVFMLLVLGVLWGGFATLLLISMRADKRRSCSGENTSLKIAVRAMRISPNPGMSGTICIGSIAIP